MKRLLSKKLFSIVGITCLMLFCQNAIAAPFLSDDGDEVEQTNTDTNIALESKIMVESNNLIKEKSQKLDEEESEAMSNITPPPQDAIVNILIQAISLMGISYKWGGNTPETGMDCSGFIRYVFKKSMGINLPRTVAEMSKRGIKVNVRDIEPGDLIFFNTLHRRRNSHIGMYIGDNKFIQSPRTGEKIQITPYNSYWRNHTNGIKRIVDQETNDEGQLSVNDYENITNQALPSGYIKSPYKKYKKYKKKPHMRQITKIKKLHKKHSRGKHKR